MSRLSYFGKSALLFIGVVILLFGTFYLYAEKLDSEIVQNEKKLQGIAINQRLFTLLRLSTHYKDRGYLCLHGGCKISDPHQLKQKLDERFLMVDDVMIQQGYALQIEPLLERARQDMHVAMQSIIHNDPRGYYEKMNGVVESIIFIMDQVNIHTVLLQEYEVDTFIRIESAFDRLPRIMSMVSELRGSGSSVLQVGSIDSVTYAHIIDLSGAVEISWVQLMARMKALVERDKELSASTETIVKQLRTFDNWIQRDIVEEQGQSNPHHFYQRGSELSDAMQEFFNLNVPYLETEIRARMNQARWMKYIIMDTLLIAGAVWLYLFIASFISVRRPIDELIEVTNEVAEGDLLARLPSRGRDEFSHISNSMNRMIDKLQAQHSLLREYKRAVDNGALVNKTDTEGIITYINPAYEALSGYKCEEVTGKSIGIFRSENTSNLKIEMLWDTIRDKQVYRGVFENRAKDGKSFFVKSTIIPILDGKGEIIEFISIMSDITALKDHEHQLENRLFTDDLTGLPNRTAFHDIIKQREDRKLILLDIDQFHRINTIYGESVGDEVIVQLGKQLKLMMGDSSLELFRLAGDEFAVLADKRVSATNFHEDVVMLSHHLNALKLSCFIHEIIVRISIGAVIEARNDGRRPLIAMASIALKAAKNGPRSYYFYAEIADKSLQLEANLATVERLDYAIKNETIICHYQPIFNVKTGEVEKFEGLMRLLDKDGTLYPPTTFIDVAKGARLYSKLTRQVMLNTLAMAELNPTYSFSVNIDVGDITDDKTAAFIIEQLHNSTAAERIMFELVESAEMEGLEKVKEFFKQLKRHGCQIAIDDFGSGYSNYAYMTDLGVDIIKIDGTLIVDIDQDQQKQRIVASIIAIAHDLGMQVVAEYVENLAVFDMVASLGADFVQGTYIAAAEAKLRTEPAE